MKYPSQIVDSHFHVFKRKEVPQAGLLKAEQLQRDFTWKDFAAAWDGLRVVSGVMVQVRDEADGLVEAKAIARVAKSNPGLKGMVAGNVLEDPKQRSALRELKRYPLVRGVRRGTQFHPNRNYLARAQMIDGYIELARLGLVGEVCVKHFQLSGVIELARACPETTLVVDHLGKPDMIRQKQPTWEADMATLAERPNVLVKISPVVQQPEDPPLDFETVGPIVRHVIDVFGWDRVLFGSNWPVSTVIVGYRAWVELLLGVLSDAKPEQLGRLFAANAVRTWSL